MHLNTELERRHWSYPIAVMGLVLTLILPAMTAAQGIKDRPGDDPATVEPLDDGIEVAPEKPDQPTGGTDWEDAGLVGIRSYESPQFEYTVDWSRDWDIDLYFDQPENDLQPVMSDARTEQDLLYLIWTGGPGEESYAIFSGQTFNRGGPDGEIEEWTDRDWIEGQWDANFEVEVLLDDTTRTSAAVLYSVVDVEDDDRQYYTVYQTYEFEDGATLYLTFSASGEWFEDSYLSWSDDVEINGEPIDVMFDWNEIEDAH